LTTPGAEATLRPDGTPAPSIFLDRPITLVHEIDAQEKAESVFYFTLKGEMPPGSVIRLNGRAFIDREIEIPLKLKYGTSLLVGSVELADGSSRRLSVPLSVRQIPRDPTKAVLSLEPPGSDELRGITNVGAQLTLNNAAVPVNGDGTFRAVLPPHKHQWTAFFTVIPPGGPPASFSRSFDASTTTEELSPMRLARVRLGTFDLFESGGSASYTGIVQWAPKLPLTPWLSFQPHLGIALPTDRSGSIFLALLVDGTFSLDGLIGPPNLSFALGGGTETWTSPNRTFPYASVTASWQLDNPWVFGLLDHLWVADAIAFPSGDPTIHQIQVGIGASW
jgi:hypothetical protein